jgi:hypothetical protein
MKCLYEFLFSLWNIYQYMYIFRSMVLHMEQSFKEINLIIIIQVGAGEIIFLTCLMIEVIFGKKPVKKEKTKNFFLEIYCLF